MIRHHDTLPRNVAGGFVRRSSTATLSIAFCLLTAVPAPGAEECSELHQGRIPNPWGQEIRVVPESAGAPVEHGAIADAVAMWTETCAEDMPAFGATGNIVLRLRFHDGPNDLPGCGDGCACTISNTRPAPGGGEYLVSSITHLFERHRDGRGFCRRHREETLAHELGHVLGFRHPEDPYSPRCSGLIMSFSRNRSVRPTDCRALTAVWRPGRGDGDLISPLLPLDEVPTTRHAEAEETLDERRDP